MLLVSARHGNSPRLVGWQGLSGLAVGLVFPIAGYFGPEWAYPYTCASPLPAPVYSPPPPAAYHPPPGAAVAPVPASTAVPLITYTRRPPFTNAAGETCRECTMTRD